MNFPAFLRSMLEYFNFCDNCHSFFLLNNMILWDTYKYLLSLWSNLDLNLSSEVKSLNFIERCGERLRLVLPPIASDSFANDSEFTNGSFNYLKLFKKKKNETMLESHRNYKFWPFIKFLFKILSKNELKRWKIEFRFDRVFCYLKQDPWKKKLYLGSKIFNSFCITVL